MSQENRVLKRASRVLMPLIPELPEDSRALTSHPETEPMVNCGVLTGEEGGGDERLLLESQAKIAGQRKMRFTVFWRERCHLSHKKQVEGVEWTHVWRLQNKPHFVLAKKSKFWSFRG